MPIFLTWGDVRVVYYADDTLDTYAVADRVAEVTEWVPEPTDLPPVVSVSEWS